MRHVAIMLIALTAALTGCASSSYNSGIQEKAPGAYFLSIRTATATGACCLSSEESKRVAVAQADEYCGRSGQVAKVTSEDLGPVTADIYFICVDS